MRFASDAPYGSKLMANAESWPATKGHLSLNRASSPAVEPTSETKDATEPILSAAVQAARDAISRAVSDSRGSAVNIEFLASCSRELDGLVEFVDELALQERELAISEVDLDHRLPNLFAPSRKVQTWALSPVVWTVYLAMCKTDQVRDQLKRVLAAKFDIEEFAPIPGHTKFDPRFHEDSASGRLPAPGKALSNAIYETVTPGFRVGSRIRKAFVRRYMEFAEVKSKSGALKPNGDDLLSRLKAAQSGD